LELPREIKRVHLAVALSSAAMTNIRIDDPQNDFTFVVGANSYSCPRVIAEFLSSRIRLLHWLDPSISEYVVETNDPSDQFNRFLSVGQGSTIDVTEGNQDLFLVLSR
jgi:hypothetical protein